MRPRRRLAGKGVTGSVRPNDRSRLWHCMMFATIVGAVAVAPLSALIVGAGQWASLEPEGGFFGTLVIDPNTPMTLYAGTDGSGFVIYSARPR